MGVFRSALQEAGSNDSRPLLLLYGADADGFSASYFLHQALAETIGEHRLNTRAIWNFDYDFEWLPDLVAREDPALVVCFDIPIVRETQVVRAVAARTPIAIYDHHVVPSDTPTDLPGMVFVNSRVLGGPTCNYPASAFGAAFASQMLGGLPPADLVVLATGLIGDRAEGRNPRVFERLYAEFPTLDRNGDGGRLLFKFTHQLDSFFRAHAHDTPLGAERTLAKMIKDGGPVQALADFGKRYRLADAVQQVQYEVDRSVHELAAQGHGVLLSAVLPVETFSVGAIASKLVAQNAADVVALGFRVDHRVAFELRTGNDGPDLTKVLAIQREQFVPLSAGGHPNAAGALVSSEAADEFERTLAIALETYRASH